MGLAIDGSGISYWSYQLGGAEKNLACAIHIDWSASILMHSYTGILTYTTDNSGRIGQSANVELRASFCPGRFTVVVDDEHSLSG